jgi:hypothetical protein
MHVVLNGVSDIHPVVLLGARYRSANPAGVIVSSFSAGGYRATSFLQSHGGCGGLIAALGIDAVVIGYGANDAAAGVSAAQFGADVAEVRALVRRWTRPDLPFLLFCDPYRQGLTSAQNAAFDRYAGAEYELARTDPATLFINSRRALEDIGWRASGSPTTYLTDGIHYTPTRARAKAAAEIGLLDSMITRPCEANCDGSTTPPVLSVNDMVCFLGHFAAGDTVANCDGSTTPPVLNVSDFICFLQAFAAGCP